MPTGYTAAAIDRRMSFKDFALRCARAFGACVELRDDSLDTPLPDEFKPSAYHIEAKASAEKELARLVAMKPTEAAAYGAKVKAESIANYERWEAKNKAENVYLKALRADVESWKPPTSEHEGMKKFMLEQIDVSMNGDYYTEALVEAKAKDADAYFRDALEAARESVEYHAKEDAKERERASGRTDWIKQLRESLR
jgi:hypothetical protein